MAKVKMSKKATSIDMTAMCDVAFLLLTFFILTATAKMPEPLPVDTPNSTVQTKLPETDLSMITVGKGKIFFGVTDREVRKKTLELMGDQFNIKFNDDEKAKFALMETFGVPLNQVKSLLALKASDRNKAGIQPGIPSDSLDNQLKEWILNARRANDQIRGNQLNFAIKGDMQEDYPEIKKVMDILQDQNVNKFNLVTGLRNENF